ncbi:PQQ-dependent sugar dehydrogenase (plasmid) [Paracoccus sp. TK19116]|uniref:PQQ-dependent sugar dehydrogenase n=1 Tax=Paracoccus albicereus TaxID=2922394 RepID=A0ABT1MMH5_9RHOB|nr:glucose/sorbosone family PQQ-dependent dehydrogenase [Paracoccus albicereus]MCQ0969490.1 PQQ-dependent sugar dehydrogenase [Paracoccus albicereus]
MAQVIPTEIETGDNALFASRVLTTDLSNPWAMRWGPDDMIWLTERTSGEVTRVDPVTGAQQVLLTIDDVYTGPQHEGLLGLALHPELMQGTGNDYVYLSYTINNGTAEEPDPSAQIMRYTYDQSLQQLTEPTVLIEGLPAWNDHNAGRVVFGPDQKIYYSIGEQGANFGRNQRRPNLAQVLPTADEVADQNWRTYSGKILRLNLDGSIPDDNPEIEGVQSHIYSYGHRNPQGLAFGPNGTLYEAEHGPATDDELNIIRAGGNYGWPRVAGYIDDQAYLYANWSEAPEGTDLNAEPIPDSVPQFPESEFEGDMVEPLQTFWTVEDDYPIGQICGYICDPTIAPSSILPYQAGEDGIAEWGNSVLISTLKHGTLYVQPLSEDGQQAEGEPVAWLSTQNRYRDVIVAPDNRTVLIATDDFGSVAQKFGEGLNTSVLHNPGAILMFTYGEDGGGVGFASDNTTLEETQAANNAANEAPQEWEDPATGKDGEEEAASVTEEANISDVAALGAPKYVETCSTCHGPAGRSDAAAVLAENQNLADPEYVARTVVHGFGYMPAFGDQLSDNDIAEIGTYIRNQWGNDFGVLTTEQVGLAR